jgi:hypothetical protein
MGQDQPMSMRTNNMTAEFIDKVITVKTIDSAIWQLGDKNIPVFFMLELNGKVVEVPLKGIIVTDDSMKLY